MKEHKFVQDSRKENPALHLHYVRSACEMLTTIDKTLTKFGSYSNAKMLGPIEALCDARAKLVREDAAYYEADQILRTIWAAHYGKHYTEPTPGEIKRHERADPFAAAAFPAKVQQQK